MLWLVRAEFVALQLWLWFDRVTSVTVVGLGFGRGPTGTRAELWLVRAKFVVLHLWLWFDRATSVAVVGLGGDRFLNSKLSAYLLWNFGDILQLGNWSAIDFSIVN